LQQAAKEAGLEKTHSVKAKTGKTRKKRAGS